MAAGIALKKGRQRLAISPGGVYVNNVWRLSGALKPADWLTAGNRHQTRRIGFDHITGVAASDHQVVAVGALSADKAFGVQKMARSMTATIGTVNDVRSLVHDQSWINQEIKNNSC